MNEKLNFSNKENDNEISIEKQKEGPLSFDKAQDTANMMRAEIGVHPNATGTVISMKEYKDKVKDKMVGWDDVYEWRNINTDVTKEDYEDALEKVEEIQKLAEEETSEEEFNFKLKKILQLTGHATFSTFLITMYAGKWLLGGDIPLLETFKKNRENLADAKTVLKRALKEGDKFGKEEKENNRQKTV